MRRQIQHNPTVTFSPAARSLVARTADALDISCRTLASATGHDARSLHAVCPTEMIFVPCRDGLSHHPDEWAEPGHLAAGARVLADVVWELAEHPGGSPDSEVPMRADGVDAWSGRTRL